MIALPHVWTLAGFFFSLAGAVTCALVAGFLWRKDSRRRERVEGLDMMDWANQLKQRVLRSAGFRFERGLWQARSYLARREVRRAAGFDVSRIFSWTTPQELVALYELAAAVPVGSHALEIGSYLGSRRNGAFGDWGDDEDVFRPGRGSWFG